VNRFEGQSWSLFGFPRIESDFRGLLQCHLYLLARGVEEGRLHLGHSRDTAAIKQFVDPSMPMSMAD